MRILAVKLTVINSLRVQIVPEHLTNHRFVAGFFFFGGEIFGYVLGSSSSCLIVNALSSFDHSKETIPSLQNIHNKRHWVDLALPSLLFVVSAFDLCRSWMKYLYIFVSFSLQGAGNYASNTSSAKHTSAKNLDISFRSVALSL